MNSDAFRFPPGQTPPAPLFEDWWQTMHREGEALAALLRPYGVARVLDLSCGTGTQSIGLARLGLVVTACDEDAAALREAEQRATEAGVSLHLVRTSLLSVPDHVSDRFDLALTLGSHFARLSEGERQELLAGVAGLLVSGGLLLIGMHDWDHLLKERPQFVPRRITKPNGHRLVMFDVWEYPESGEAVRTTFTLRDERGEWGVATRSQRFFPLRANDFWHLAREAGYRVIEQLQAGPEVWWLLQLP